MEIVTQKNVEQRIKLFNIYTLSNYLIYKKIYNSFRERYRQYVDMYLGFIIELT